jgi:ubiquinone/menaquinone biosynthesis C-methylase UbiE
MSDVKEAVRRQFEAAAEHYRTSAVHAGGDDLLRMVQAAQLSGVERVLDAGCGAGHASAAVAPYAAEVVALDLSEAMLAQARRLAAERGLSNLVTRWADVEALPFADVTFDRVISRYSAHHWPDPGAALREIRRVLRPGGTFILGDIVAPGAPTLDTFLQTIELLRDPSHVRDHSAAQWINMLAGAGFEAESIFTWSLTLDFPAWLARIHTPPQNAAVIEALFDGSPAEVQAEFQWHKRQSFAISGALYRAIRTP